MTISSSLNAGVAGLSVNAGKLAAISDNIANAGTYGYKRADSEFASMVVDSPAGRYAAGGVTSTTKREISAEGSIVTTANALDVSVTGRGMLPVRTVAGLGGAGPQELLLTSTGSFSPDRNGLVRTSSGFALMGWPVNPDGTTATRPRDSAAGLEPVTVGAGELAASPTTDMTLGINLPATETAAGASGAALSVPVEYFDNLGASQQLTATFTPTVPATGASNAWRLEFTDSAGGAAPVASYDLTFDDTRGAGGALASVTPVGAAAYDAATGVATVPVAGGPIDVELGPIGPGSPLTQLAADFAPTGVGKNGNAAGILTGMEFDDEGYLYGIYDTGFRRRLFQIPVADVPNPDGLQMRDGQTFSVTQDSGAFYLWDSGDGPAGRLSGYSLEESTTDLAAELTQLIETQRAYSSNAKVIQTVDEMLQETTNIKR